MGFDLEKLGDIQKNYERVEAGRAIMPGIPVLARLDGRAFHTFTKGLQRPFDDGLGQCMVQTTKRLVERFNASVGYTQSDEITLCWANIEDDETKLVFGGKFQKLCSILAADATLEFVCQSVVNLPKDHGGRALFDCRVWQVPNLGVAAGNFVWRELDATKNSVSMAASTYYSHKQLDGKSHRERKDMLLEKDIVWEEYPAHFKRGLYFRRVKEERFLTKEELQLIHIDYRPVGPVVRSTIKQLDLPPITTIGNVEDVLFKGAEPLKCDIQETIS